MSSSAFQEAQRLCAEVWGRPLCSFSVNNTDEEPSIFIPVVLLEYSSTLFSVQNKISYSDIVMEFQGVFSFN